MVFPRSRLKAEFTLFRFGATRRMNAALKRANEAKMKAALIRRVVPKRRFYVETFQLERSCRKVGLLKSPRLEDLEIEC